MNELTDAETKALEELINALAKDLVAHGVPLAGAKPLAAQLVMDGWRK
jgi:hypothetical protein